MRKIPLALIILSAFYGCQQSENNTRSEPQIKRVYTTNYPLYFMAEYMAPAGVSVHFPAHDAGDPAYWQPPVDSLAAMQQADLIITNGASYEQWMSTVSLPVSKVVNSSGGFQQRLIDSQEVITHSHGDEGAHQHVGTAFTTWMDLELAAEQAAAISNALTGIMPDEQELIEMRYEELQSQLIDLHEAYKKVCENISLSVAYSHPVYQYFQNAYQLPGTSLLWEPDQTITEDQLEDLNHMLEHHQVDVLIWETEPLAATVDTLERLGVKSIVVEPMGSRPGAEEPDFLEGLRRNLEQLQLIN
jgi:zinc transport system substrate-binding protein